MLKYLNQQQNYIAMLETYRNNLSSGRYLDCYWKKRACLLTLLAILASW